MISDFRPINPHGRSATPDGKPPVPRRESLYQVQVEDQNGHLIQVGPKMVKRAAEGLLMAINAKIAEGKERLWSNPHLVQATIMH